MDETRARRLAANEALFRHANEAARKTEETLVSVDGVVCECAQLDCEATIGVSSEIYMAVRQNPMRFFVKDGHADPRIERVVEELDGFHIIEKIGPGRPVAEKLAPRQSPSTDQE